MKQLILFIALSLTCLVVKGQRHELGLFIGGANGITDIGRTNYIYPVPQNLQDGNTAIPYVIGGMYRFNFDPQIGLRANALFSRIVGNDLNAVEDYRIERGYDYDNNIFEFSILLEYNFFDFNTIQKSAHTPFIFIGGGVFGAKDREYQITHQLTTDTNGNETPLNADGTGFTSILAATESYDFGFAMPFGVGYKIKYNWNWVISFEIGARMTNNDNLDFSIPNVEDFTIGTTDGLLNDPNFNQTLIDNSTTDLISGRQTGDISDNDWYVFTGVGVTYTFGRPPCYCN